MHSKILSEGLADLARANERKRDAALLSATTELFMLDVIHDRDELRRFEELATHLLPKVTIGDRESVAERLAACADAPVAVVRMLARDVITVAGPILRHSSALGPIDLLGVIASTGVEHHRLIARRAQLPAEVIHALRLTGDAEIIARVGDGAPLSTQEGRVEKAPMPAQPNGVYHSNRLDPWRFLALDRTARLRLIADIAAHPPALPHTSNPTRLDRAFRSILGAAQIVGYARGGQLGAIVAALSESLSLPPSLGTAAIHDQSGELLAVMLKALRLDDTQARQVFLLASPSGRDVRGFFPLSDLFSGMEPSVAETLVDAWRAATAPGKEKYEPLMAENGDRRRSTRAVDTHQPAAHKNEEQARRA
jgi:Uncharacterised protein conserved in bacteria (DUF2336)